MNRRSSLIALGVGAAAYAYARRTNMLSPRSMKKARKMIKSFM